MKTIALEVPDDLVGLSGASDEALARDLRLAAAIQWYSQGVVSQGRAAARVSANCTPVRKSPHPDPLPQGEGA
jgi:hypothetical protein